LNLHGDFPTTRERGDLEIAVPADRSADIARRFPDCEFHVAGGGLYLDHGEHQRIVSPP
jgi:hypothetical protein